jgi:hypothetical protein
VTNASTTSGAVVVNPEMVAAPELIGLEASALISRGGCCRWVGVGDDRIGVGVGVGSACPVAVGGGDAPADADCVASGLWVAVVEGNAEDDAGGRDATTEAVGAACPCPGERPVRASNAPAATTVRTIMAAANAGTRAQRRELTTGVGRRLSRPSSSGNGIGADSS